MNNNNTWFWLDYYKDEIRIKEYLAHKIESDRYNEYFEKILSIRGKFDLKFEEMEKITLDTIENQSYEIIYSIRQASECFKLSKEANLNIKPLLVYYGMISLSKALMDSTFIFPGKKLGHGLTTPKNPISYNECKILERGLFPRFSACNNYRKVITLPYENILNHISKKNYFNFKDLFILLIEDLPMHFSIEGTVKEIDVYNNVFGEPEHRYPLDPISANYILMYLLSNFVRYAPVKWIDMIEGRDEAYPRINWILPPILNAAILNYPYFILNEMRKYSSDFPFNDEII